MRWLLELWPKSTMRRAKVRNRLLTFAHARLVAQLLLNRVDQDTLRGRLAFRELLEGLCTPQVVALTPIFSVV